MKIFGKEMNLSDKKRTIAIVITVVMVAVLATAVFAIVIPTKNVAVHAVNLETANGVVIGFIDNYDDFDKFSESEISAAKDIPFTSNGEITIKGRNDQKGTTYTMSTDDAKNTLTVKESTQNLPASFNLYLLSSEPQFTATITDKNGKQIDRKELSYTKNYGDGLVYGTVLSLSPANYGTSEDVREINIRFAVLQNVTVSADSNVSSVTVNNRRLNIGSTTRVERTEKFSPTVVLNKGYEIEYVEFGGNVIEEGSIIEQPDSPGTYTIDCGDLKTDKELVIHTKLCKIDVIYSLPADKDIKFTHNIPKSKKDTVNYGDTVTFTITPVEGYEYPEVTVTPETVRINKNNGTYSFVATDNVNITINNAQPKEYTVSWPSKVDNIESINVTGVDENGGKAKYNTNITIKVKPADGYNADVAPTVTAAGNYLTSTGGNATDGYTYDYTVKGDTSIMVSGLKKNTYTIAAPDKADGFTTDFTTAKTVEHGGSISFTVIPANGYEAPTVMWGGDTIIPVGNTYTINNITKSNIVTIAAGLQTEYDLKYVVNAASGSGANVVFKKDGSVVSKANYNDEVTVEITPNDNTNWDGTLTVNGIPAEVKENKTTFTVTGHTTVAVSGLSVKTHTVTLESPLGIATSNGLTQTAVHNGECTFILQLSNGYTVDADSLRAYVWNNGIVSSSIGDNVIFNPANGTVTIKCTQVKDDGVVRFGGSSTPIDSTCVKPIEVSSLSDKSILKYTMSNGTAQISLQANPGYKITSATVADLPIGLTNNGNGLYTSTINVGYSDINISVKAEPITATVTYVTNPVYINENLTIIGNPYSVPVPVSDSIASALHFDPIIAQIMPMMVDGDNTTLTVDSGVLTLTLDVNKFNNGMFEQDGSSRYFNRNITTTLVGASVLGTKITIPTPNSYDDFSITVTANYQINPSSVTGIPFIKFSPMSPETAVTKDPVTGKAVFRWREFIDYDCGDLLKSALIAGGYNVDAYGFVIGKDNAPAGMETTIESWARSANAPKQEGSGKSLVWYTYVDNTVPTAFVPGYVNYSATANIEAMSTETGSYNRYGYFWFRANVGGNIYVHAEKVLDLDAHSIAGSTSFIPENTFPDMLG